MIGTRYIPVDNLRLDPTNPRLASATSGQAETLRAIATHQGPKLRMLARDIVRYGTNPSELSIVLERADESFTVLEGNRRLSAILALANPDSIDGAVSSPVLTAMRDLSEEYVKEPIEELHCVIVEDENEARHWLELRHTGELGGAGLSPWGADEAQRFRARSGQPLRVHTQALDFLQGRGDITAEERSNIPTTTLRRLLEAPDVRAKLGIQWSNRTLTLLASPDLVARALLYVISDITTGGLRVGDVYTKERRTAYAQELPEDIVVTPDSTSRDRAPAQGPMADRVTSTQNDLGEAGEGDSAPRPPSTHREPQRSPGPRDRLIPEDCRLRIDDERLRDIEQELRVLSLDRHANAISVLFRVFIELSADAYIERVGLARPSPEQDTLASKLQAIADHLVEHQKLTPDEATPVRRAAQRDSFLAPSVKLVQQWVHNRHVFPAPSDLRAHWNNLQPWFVAVWPT